MAITPDQEAAARALLAKGDALGQQASAVTGQAYNPSYTTAQPSASPTAYTVDGLSSGSQSMTVPSYNPAPPQSLDLKSIIDSINQPSQQETALKSEQNNILGQIQDIIAKQGSRASEQLNMENAAGLPDLKKNLADITANINAINSSAFQATQNSENRIAPTFAIYGEQAQIERQRSAQTYGLAAAASAIQGNIALKEEYIGKALDAEFAPLEGQLQYAQTLLNLNQQNLSEAQSKKLQIAQIALDERSRLLAEQKTDREGIYNLMTTLASNGAPTSVINTLQSASSYSEAIRLAAPYMQSPEQKLALQNAQLDLQYKKNQILLQQIQISQGNSVTKATSENLLSVLGGNKIGQTTKTQVGLLMGVINASEDLAKARPGGQFTGLNPVMGLVPNNFLGSSSIENRGYIEGINLKVQQWASGASLTAQQTEQVNKMTPTKYDTDATIRSKLNNLVNFMNQQIKGQLAAEGIDYEPDKVDLFAPDTLDTIFGTGPDWSAFTIK